VNAYWAGSSLVVLRRGEDGQVARRVLPAEHVSFVRAEDMTPDLRSALRSSRFVLGMVEEPGGWVRVRWLTRDAAKKAADPGNWFDRQGVKVYEADVDPVRRWLTESGVTLQKPRRVFLDFEADSRVPFSQMGRMRVLAWSLVAPRGGLRTAQVLGAEDDDAEAALLRALWRELLAYDQVVSWNGDRFDFKLLQLRTEALGIAVEPRRWLWCDHMRVFERMNAHASESGEEKQSLALGSVARAILGEDEKKLVKLGELGGPTSWGMWAEGGAAREELRLYCLDDSDKMARIEEATGYLDLLQSIADVTNTLADSRAINPTRYVDGYLLRLGRERGMRFPTWIPPERKGQGDGEGEDEPKGEGPPGQFRGAFVLEPTRRGVLHNVHVADFARLYPSCVQSFNLSPETYQPEVVLRESAMGRPSYLAHVPLRTYPRPKGTCEVPIVDRCFAVEPEGVLPLMISEMLRLRREWDDRKKQFPPGTPEWKEADRRSQAYKIAANACYGVVGSHWSRFFARDVAESIAQAGVWLIHETIRAAEERGWRVVYGDTDSLFVVGPDQAGFERFVAGLNQDLYPRLLAEKGAPKCTVKLEAEKGFDVLLLIRSKGYAGRYAYFKGKPATKDSKPEIKGLEYKRGDALRLARRMQEEVIFSLLGGDERAETYVALVERWRRRVLEEPLDLPDVVQSKRLSKPINEYARERRKDGTWSARPPHVEVAAVLRERGAEVGSGVRIEFFLVDGSTSPARYAPAMDWAGEVDRFGVWEDAVYPPTQRVLEACFPGTSWTRWAKARPPRARGAPRFAPGDAALFDAKQLRQVPLGVAEGAPAKRAPARRRSAAAGQGSLAFARPEAEEPPHPLGGGGDDGQ
jgi:DNA polymerase elongation subunit (family B)